jgi:hypothetical protein
MLMIKRLFIKILGLLSFKGSAYVLVLIFRIFAIKERKKNGKDSLFFTNAKNKKTILALDRKRYRGDLEALAENPEFRVLHISHEWQSILISRFYGHYELLTDLMILGHPMIERHERCQDFLQYFLRKLYSFIKIDAVIGVTYRYLNDYDWSLASERIGVPFIMLYRECLMNTPMYTYDIIERTAGYPKFHGSHIIVHNEICKSLFTDSKFCPSNKISVLGAIRMDGLIKKLKSRKLNKDSLNRRKRFVLFYFPYDINIFGRKGAVPPNGYPEIYKYSFNIWKDRKVLFEKLHEAIIELAIENPDIDFIIKPKIEATYKKSWDFYQSIIKKHNYKKLPNYFISHNVNVHSLISSADVICGLQSSAVIESAVFEKHIVFPLFENYMNNDNFQTFGWRNHLNLFDIALTKNDFIKIVNKRLKTEGQVSSEIVKLRWDLYRKYFNTSDADVSDRYYSVITKIINKQ